MSYKKLGFSAFVAVITLSSSWSYAAPLNLDLTEFDPDISFSLGSVTYDAATDQFDMTAGADMLYSGSSDQEISGTFFGYLGEVTLNAEISAGGTLVGGSLSVVGDTSGSIINASGTLLTADLFDFGFSNDSQQILEFRFDPTGGELAPFYALTPGGFGGIIISVTGYNDQNFNTSFSGSAFGTFGDIAPIPIPASAWLFVSALFSTIGLRARVKY